MKNSDTYPTRVTIGRIPSRLMLAASSIAHGTRGSIAEFVSFVKAAQALSSRTGYLMGIDNIAWAVQPANTKLNRPTRLVSELVRIGRISPEAVRWFHGRSAGTSGHCKSLSTNPGSSLKNPGEYAILSPLFLWGTSVRPTWTDLYDDWSLAPDIRVPYRVLAAAGYRRVISKGKRSFGLITVNSQYMARKIGLRQSLLVPNGVDEELSSIPHTGDERRRVLLLGHFFRGRTDTHMIRRIASLPDIEELVIGGPGGNVHIQKLIAELQYRYPKKVQVHEWLDHQQIGKLTGSQTVALIPNLVNDYTLSQDLMKAYTFMGLGLPTICPSALWPGTMERRFAFLTGHGDRLESHISSWISAPRPSPEWRKQFVQDNSWGQRAKVIAEAMP